MDSTTQGSLMARGHDFRHATATRARYSKYALADFDTARFRRGLMGTCLTVSGQESILLSFWPSLRRRARLIFTSEYMLQRDIYNTVGSQGFFAIFSDKVGNKRLHLGSRYLSRSSIFTLQFIFRVDIGTRGKKDFSSACIASSIIASTLML